MSWISREHVCIILRRRYDLKINIYDDKTLQLTFANALNIQKIFNALMFIIIYDVIVTLILSIKFF